MCGMNAVRSPMAEALARNILPPTTFVASAGVRAGDVIVKFGGREVVEVWAYGDSAGDRELLDDWRRRLRLNRLDRIARTNLALIRFEKPRRQSRMIEPIEVRASASSRRVL